MTLRILLVDDNATFTAAARLVLNLLPGVSIAGQATSGAEALAQAEATRPDLVLLDIAMPGMSGLEVARLLHGAPHCPAVIFLSSCEAGVYREIANRLGALACVDKADLVVELLPLIETLAAGRHSQNMPHPLPA